MTQTLDSMGRPLFFPPSLETDEHGVIVPRPHDELVAIVEAVAPAQLFPFLRKLINVTSKRKRDAKWAAVNEQRLLIAGMVIERALRDRLYNLPRTLASTDIDDGGCMVGARCKG